MKKHAYLIMAHTQFELLKILLECLDDVRNDIYVHVDRKAEDFDLSFFSGILKYAALYWTDRMDVRWGSDSQIACELLLLKEATRTEHAYYHLLSGMDLPIKTQEQIHRFFEAYDGMEFIDEDTPCISEESLARVRYYHHFYGARGSLRDILGALEQKGQRLLRIDRLKNNQLTNGNPMVWQKGMNWFSITHSLALQVLNQEAWIQKTFAHTVCADEIFLQTIAESSSCRDRIANAVRTPQLPPLRLIDWARGTGNNPYVFKIEDYEVLKQSESLFARKFDWNIDRKIIERMYEDVKAV